MIRTDLNLKAVEIRDSGVIKKIKNMANETLLGQSAQQRIGLNYFVITACSVCRLLSQVLEQCL